MRSARVVVVIVLAAVLIPIRLSAAPPAAGDRVETPSLEAPAGACPLDIYFVMDMTGSFLGEVGALEAAAPTLLPALLAENPNTRFGLGWFQDFPILTYGDPGDQAYQRAVDLTSDTAAFIAGISGLTAGGGGDLKESQRTAVHQAATGLGTNMFTYTLPPGLGASFRPGATKLLILWTDALFHQHTDYQYAGAASYAQAVSAVEGLNHAMVLGVSSDPHGGLTDLGLIAAATGALAPAGGVHCDGDEVVDILEGQPLVCEVGSAGEGISDVILALVRAAAECRVYLPAVLRDL